MDWPTLDGAPPRIIAHRGASGPMPEHTLEGYALALEQGADVIEPDLVSSRDAQLVIRHDRDLTRSTDIATRPEFAARRRNGDWWIEDLDLAEIARLRAVQPFPSRDHAYDGRFRIPTFAAALLWAETEARRSGGSPSRSIRNSSRRGSSPPRARIPAGASCRWRGSATRCAWRCGCSASSWSHC